jgi:hypothetical protein
MSERPRIAGLADGHLEDLLRSGLSAETILGAQIYSASGPEASALVGYGVGPGMVIPYAGNGYARVKLDHAGTDGKRYRSPKGRGNHLYIPRMLDAFLLADVEQPIYITEGEKKCLRAVQDGLPCLALSGVWSWRQKGPDGGPSVPIPDLDLITWAGRTVFIVFDSDLVTNPDVQAAERELAKELTRRGAAVFAIRLPAGPDGAKVGLDDYLLTHTVDALCAIEPVELFQAAPVLGIGLGTFLAQTFPPVEPFIDGILSSDGPGWIAGEEKLGKTIYALAEALSLALALPLCGRFPVPTRRRVLFVEEEDSPRRTHTRLRALLRGHGLDPDSPAVQADLDACFQLAVWQGFTFDKPEMLARMEATIARVRPALVYLDVLRKLTTQTVREDAAMAPILATLDDWRRRFGALFRVVHHYRKGQGFRTGRGSQELGGSYVLGAWGENSVFLEPIGRKQGAVKVEIQSKDGPPVAGFRLTIESEGPGHAPTLLRLVAADAADEQSFDDVVLQAVATLPTTAADAGRPGVSIATLVTSLKKTDKTIRRSLKRLIDAKLVRETGKASKQQALYGVID